MRGLLTCSWFKKIALIVTCVSAQCASAINFIGEATLTSSVAETDGLLTLPAFSGIGSVGISEGEVEFRGTGVLVANSWVLTAAHNWDASALTALSFNWNGENYAAQTGSWFQPSGWLANPEVGLTQGWDLALFQLSEPILGATPAVLATEKVQLGSEVTFFGAGLTGSGSSLQSNPSATIYAGTNIIDRILEIEDPYGSSGLLAFDFDDGSSLRNSLATLGVADVDGVFDQSLSGVTLNGGTSEIIPTLLEATTAPGDSGGPVFADFGTGPELVGVISWGVNPTEPNNLYGSTLGDITYLTDISKQLQWIYSIIPEPSFFGCFLGVFSLLGAVLRRNRNSRALNP